VVKTDGIIPMLLLIKIKIKSEKIKGKNLCELFPAVEDRTPLINRKTISPHACILPGDNRTL
tara:strand:- start:176 stop:361 length:186 start_codon:yes stop_codon:yes gene_type:complete